MRTQRRNPAFTMVELLVVVVVIAILVGIVVMVSGRVLNNAKKEHTRTFMRTIMQTVEAYRDLKGNYPGDGGDMTQTDAGRLARNTALYNTLTAEAALQEKLGTLPPEATKANGVNGFYDAWGHVLDYRRSAAWAVAPYGPQYLARGGGPLLESAGPNGDWSVTMTGTTAAAVPDHVYSDNRPS